MSTNPFSPPHADISLNAGDPAGIRSRVFRVRPMSFVFFGKQKMERLRREAEEFINREVGAKNVISIVENVGYEFSVVVWFRTARK